MDEADAAELGAGRSFFGSYSSILVAAIIYVTVVAAAYIRFGTLPEVTMGAVAVLIIPCAGLVLKSKDFLKSSALLVAVLLTYEALQGVTGFLTNSRNVFSLAWADQALVGSDFTLAVQKAFFSPVITLVSTVFYGLHIFLIMFALGLFWFKDKEVYRRYTYSLVITSYSALMTFVALPTAPPWLAGSAQNLLGAGFKELPSLFQQLANVLLSGESDVVAAFPSLHVAYVTLFSIFMFKLNRKYGLMSLPVAGGVYFSVIYLGQHYLVDVLGGIAYAGIAAYVVDRVLTRGKPKFQSSPSGVKVSPSAG